MQSILDWLDLRTDYRMLLIPIRRRVLPSGPRWSYCLASCLLWLFVVQLVTGLFLMTTYSPSTTSAWASVHYVEQSPFGSFLRGLHYFAAHAMIVLAVIHVARVLLSAAFRAPRELIWISGLLLIPLTVVWAMTGNPLSASQKGIAQIEVEGNIIGSTPVIGPLVKRILLGGEEVGHLTLTHLYFLHVGLLPILVTVLLALHVTQIYRHGLSPQRSRNDGASARPYWPYQSVRNAAAVTILMIGLAVLAVWFGAPLEAPADPLLPHVPRPEWYFRFLFELRRYFTGQWEFVATIVIPLTALLVLLAVPVIDRWFRPRLSFALRCLIVVASVGALGALTYVSLARDWQDPEYGASVKQSQEWANRARALADSHQVPPEGAIALLRDDPQTQGPLLFRRHCSSCHSYASETGRGILAVEPSAPNLYGFASHEWIAGLLDDEQINSARYFGNTKMAHGEMATMLGDKFGETAADDEKAGLSDQLRFVARALSAEAGLPAQTNDDARDAAMIETGRKLLVGELGCTDCHRYHEQGELGSAPDLTGYGTREWIGAMIGNPEHERFYGDGRNDRMPAFAASPHNPQTNLLSTHEINLIAAWLRGE